MPFFVAMKFSSPAPSSFLRRRATFTLSVFSSTKLSDSHSQSHQHVARDGLALVLHQHLQNAVLVLRQLHPLPVIGEGAVVGVEHGVPMLEQARLPAEIVGTAGMACTFAVNTFRSKGLGDEIVRAHVYGHDDVHVVRRRGDEYYRHAGEAAYLSAPVIAVIKRQADVKQDERGSKSTNSCTIF